MNDLRSYESRIADPNVKCLFSQYQPSHEQAADRNSREPGDTDDHFASPRQTQAAQRSAMSALKDPKVDQAGMVWGCREALLPRVEDDSLENSEKVEDYRPLKKGEVVNKVEQEIGQALAHETATGTSLTSAREHIFYKVNPDERGQYKCPYDALEHCWYMPQNSKSKYDEHLDTHLKPYRCTFSECEDAHFSSPGGLRSHEVGVHKILGNKAKTDSGRGHDEVNSSDENITRPFPRRPLYEDAAAHVSHEPFCDPPVRSIQASDRPEFGDANVSEDVKKAFELDPPAGNYCVSGMWFPPKHTVTSASRCNPKLASLPTNLNAEQHKEDEKRIVVDVDFLHKLESKINDLQFRVEECEGRPVSPTNSSISDSEDSVGSASVVSHRSIREARNSRHFDDDIILCEPEENHPKVVHFDGPSLRVARWKCFDDLPSIETLDEWTSSSHAGRKPLLRLMEDYCSNNKLWRRRLEIASPAFYELLREVSCHNLNDTALHEGVFYLTEPFMVLFLNRKQLAEYVEKTIEVTQAKQHAGFILDFLKSDFGDVSRMLDNFESVTPPNLVQYCDLWMLYRPGTTVYSHANGEWEAFVIDSLDGMQVRKPSMEYDHVRHHALTRLDVRAWSMNFDGEVYGRVWSLHCVAPFLGVKNISSLPLVPEKYLLDGKAIRESLLSRGNKFCASQVQHCELIGTSPSRVMVDHLTYQKRNGWLISINGKYAPSSNKNRSWTQNSYSDWDTSGEAFDRRPRRYTPQRSLVRHFENEYCNRDYELEGVDKVQDTQAEPCRTYSTDRPSHVVVREFEKYNLVGSAEMDELSLMLCPQHVRAFSFPDKLWKFINVSQLKPVTFHDNAWDYLVLDEEYKDILGTMISSHSDKIAGLNGSTRGKGLSILLHGEPGVGKTLAAECIAEHFGKPLFPVTCSDIGTSVTKFDEKLEEISDYATKWDAILLFDEADVLLQARRDYECANLRRNDLVSSFVRFIEYYQGIVFITTNRISRFDGAIVPRIDITLGLPPLDRGRRTGIWHNWIQHLVEEGSINGNRSVDLRVLAEEKWSKDDFNGHQIRKVIKTARVVAEKKGRMLGHKEIETMLKMEREFQERISHVEKDKDKTVGGKKEIEDLEGFEQVEKP